MNTGFNISEQKFLIYNIYISTLLQIRTLSVATLLPQRHSYTIYPLPKIPNIYMDILNQAPGVNLVAATAVNPLEPKGSAMCPNQLSTGPFPVTIAYTKKPNMENIARRPFLSSLTLSSAKVSGSSAKFRGSKASPGYSLSRSSPAGPPLTRYPSISPIRRTWVKRIARMD